MTTERATPTAFVIMPFNEEFTGVYETLYCRVLEEAGFAIERADTHPDPTNIITKIILKIHSADLIIADLSGANPNVYYELGLANAMDKPVVMLVRDINELRFDLNGYQVISYGDAGQPTQKAHSMLKDIINRFLSGDAEFSSPYAAALGTSVQTFHGQEISDRAKTTPERGPSTRNRQ